MKTPKNHWLFDSKLSHTKMLSSLFFFFVEFVKDASQDDVKVMLHALPNWSEDPKADGWFTTCLYQLCGVPLPKLLDTRPLTLRQLRAAAEDYSLKDRAEFIGAHLDLVHADHYERAFLAVCQKLIREETARPPHQRGLRIAKLLNEASTIMSRDVLGSPPKHQRRRTKSRISAPTAKKASKAA